MLLATEHMVMAHAHIYVGGYIIITGELSVHAQPRQRAHVRTVLRDIYVVPDGPFDSLSHLYKYNIRQTQPLLCAASISMETSCKLHFAAWRIDTAH